MMTSSQADFGDDGAESRFSVGGAQCTLSTVAPETAHKSAKLQHVLHADGVRQEEHDPTAL